LDRFLRLAGLLHEAKARFVVIGVWGANRVEDVEIPVARLSSIVASKAKANRPKDRLFLETHAEALRQLVEED